MSPSARLMLGITLVTVPAIAFGGFAVLGVLTRGEAGLPGAPELTPQQLALYRAGHAHAGVLVVLSLVLQVLLDHARLSASWAWTVRVTAPLAAILVSAGFFGLAHAPELRGVLYAGALLVAFATVTAGVGLLRAVRPEVPAGSRLGRRPVSA
jgi:hypothetical protein